MMSTPNGKTEFVSTFLQERFPENKERSFTGRFLPPREGKDSPPNTIR
jgi:hypothetical protein